MTESQQRSVSTPFESLARKGSISIFRDGLPAAAFEERDRRNAIIAQLGTLDACPNYWLPLDAIRSNELRSPAERIVADLYRRCILPHVLPNQEITGAEYWTQQYTKGRGLAFHVDKDEHAMKTRGEMINPQYSSVLYLTGGEQAGSDGRLRVQSPTVITDEHYDQERRRMVPVDFPTESCLVFPKANRYLVFDGRAGHGVLDLGQQDGDEDGDTDGDTEGDTDGDRDGDVRMTFLVNWWGRQPEGIERDDRASFDAMSEGIYGDVPSQPVASKEPVYVLSITKQYLFANEPFMMDEFLREQDIVKDDDSISPVILRHSGVVMVPFRPAGDEARGVATRRIVDCALISQENHSLYI